jgi:zinc-ribbon domain
LRERGPTSYVTAVMSSIPCINCGAELTPGMKFCRRCGQPSLDTTSVSEATTRVFEATREPAAAPTQTWNAQPTGPAYMAPGDAQHLQDVNTRSLGPTAGQGRQTSKLVLMFALLFAAMLMAFVIGMRLSRRSAPATAPQTPPAVARPGTDLPPPPPPLPPIEQPPPASGTSMPTSELIYPGSETVMDMRNERDNFLQLRTTDAPDKVVDWYMTKLKATEIIRTPRAGAVLRAGATHVIISARGSGSDIIIKQGG